ASLRRQGWRVRHSRSGRGRGDIDSVAIAPGGFAFAIEVKTSRYDDGHLSMVREQAAWLWRFRRRGCRSGVMPLLCVTCSRGVQRWEDGVLVVSIDRLTATLRWAANLVHSARGSR
ncbi:MAG: nuclease-related domain-containing protein, partial [Solirubrobacteraceae bacterium]